MSFNRKYKSRNNIFQRYSSILENVKDVLSKKFECLSISQAVSQNDVPFLHVWKPITQTEGVQGMPFLPCFHIIVTVTGQDDEDVNDVTEANCDTNVLFQLHSFHGKVIADESIVLEKCKKGANYDLVQKMAEDRIQICRGIDEVNKGKFTNFLASCELPLLGKIKSVFLIEQLMGEVILRSRLCEFALYDDLYGKERIYDGFVRCQECEAFQDHSQEMVDSNKNGNFKFDPTYYQTDENVQNFCDTNDNIPYERVFHQTTISDGQAMEVYDKAKYLYDFSSDEIPRSLKKLKRKAKKINTKIPLNHDLDVKTEPSDVLTNEQKGFHITDNQPTCDSSSSINLDHEVSNTHNEMGETTYCEKIEQNITNKNINLRTIQ